MGFDPSEPRDHRGRWTADGSAEAIRKAASDGPGTGFGYAPYRAKEVNSLEQDAQIRGSEANQIYQQLVGEAAASLGINITSKIDTWGGYVDNETKQPVQEVSNVIQTDATPDQAELLAAIMGKIAPEQQDSVLVGHHDPAGNGIEYTLHTGSFDNARKAIGSMNENGIQYFSINKSNGDIILLDTDNSISKNVHSFISDLQKKNLYEGGEFSTVNANFIGSQDYDRIIAKARSETRPKNGFDIDSFIKKGREKYAGKIK